MCDTAIEEVYYQRYYAYYNGDYYAKNADNEWLYEEDGETMIYANNYKYSTLRKYLTQDFYNRAFSNKQKTLINLTEVDNSVQTTDGVDEKYACENTNDYVFALSYADFNNSEYGLTDPLNCCFYFTDFAKATGVVTYTKEYWDWFCCMDPEDPDIAPYVNTGMYLLRSPCYYDYGWDVGVGDAITYLDCGNLTVGWVDYANLGVIPAMYVTL